MNLMWSYVDVVKKYTTRMTENLMKKQIAVLCNSMRFALMGTMTVAILASVATGWMKGNRRAGAYPEPTLKIDNQPLKREGSMAACIKNNL